MNTEWNYGDIIEAMERITPGDQPALIHGDRAIDRADLKHRSNNLANNMLANWEAWSTARGV